jgi:hypothetical protein
MILFREKAPGCDALEVKIRALRAASKSNLYRSAFEPVAFSESMSGRFVPFRAQFP